GVLALGWLALMVLYKLCDAFALSLSTTFLLRVPQFSLTQLGAINKTFGLAAGLLGALAGGWVVTRMRLFPALLVTALCNVRYSATQYALLSSLSAVGRVFLGPLAAWLVPQVGWSSFFAITALSALPGLLLVLVLRRAIDRAELARPH